MAELARQDLVKFRRVFTVCRRNIPGGGLVTAGHIRQTVPDTSEVEHYGYIQKGCPVWNLSITLYS